MSDRKSSTRTSRLIEATRQRIYEAFTGPDALETWLAPGDMTGKIHAFDLRVGGGYEMSLFYPEEGQTNPGKTSGKEDRLTTKFVELTPPSKIVQRVNFNSEDPKFQGEMTMIVTLEESGKNTNVTIEFENIPAGIRPEDNDTGTRESLEKLAAYVQ